MNEWSKVLVPILLTAIGVMVFDLFGEIKDIKEHQIKSNVWIYRVEQNEMKIKVLEEKQ